MKKDNKFKWNKEFIFPFILTLVAMIAGIYFTQHYIAQVSIERHNELMATSFMTFTSIMAAFLIFIVSKFKS